MTKGYLKNKKGVCKVTFELPKEVDAENAAVVSAMMFDLVAEVGAALVLVTHARALAAQASTIFLTVLVTSGQRGGLLGR